MKTSNTSNASNASNSSRSLLSAALVMFACAQLSVQAQETAKTTSQKIKSKGSAARDANTILIRPNRKAETSSSKTHAMNTFSDMSQSMPAEAVKEELARKHALPGQQTSVLTPGNDNVNGGISSPTINNAATGDAPRIQTGSGMSIPQPTGASTSVFK